MQQPDPINADIREAKTLPGRFYADQATYQALLDKALVPGWSWVGHAQELEAGQARPVRLLPGSLDEPLLLLRDGENSPRCFSNVCTHRGCLLLEKPAKGKSLRCNYHGRRFGLDGRMQHMPDFEETQDFPRPEDDLPELPLFSICNALFTSLAPRQEFDQWIAPMAPLLATLPQADFRWDPKRSVSYDMQCHWALYLDNYLEGFHIPFVHPGLARVLSDGDYETELFESASLQVGVARPGQVCFEEAQTVGQTKGPVGAYYYWLSPTTLFNFYPWGLSVNVIEPRGLNKTRVHFHSYVWREDLLDTGAGSDLATVQAEDENVVARVHQGLRSRLYRGGRFSPSKEQGVHHFHRWLAQVLA